MGAVLTKGARFGLSREAPAVKNIQVELSWQVNDPGLVLDASVFLLNERNRISSERDIVFYNNLRSGDGAVVLSQPLPHPGETTFIVDLTRLRADVLELLFILSVREGSAPDKTFRNVRAASIRLIEFPGGRVLTNFPVAEGFPQSRCIEMGRLYRRNGEWRFQAVGEGYADGLRGVVARHGGQPVTPQAAPPTPPPQPIPRQPARPERQPLSFPGFAPPQPTPLPMPTGPVCARCSKPIGVMDRLTLNDDRRCRNCRVEVKNVLFDFRHRFTGLAGQGIATGRYLEELFRLVETNRVDRVEALTFIQKEAVAYLEQMLTFAASDNEITQEEYDAIHATSRELRIPGTLSKPLLDRLEYLRALTRIRAGELPRVRTHFHIDSDEVCHLDIPCAYRKTTRTKITDIHGYLLATSKKIHFISPGGGWGIAYKNVMLAKPGNGAIFLELTVTKGSGIYLLSDPWMAEAVITAVTRMHKRQLVAPGQASRHIPQDIKVAVWQRDQGRCVECGADQYLEFDHIIPFSRGGATSLNNLQLLCRNCNNAKRDRI